MSEEPIWSVGLVVDDLESRRLSENSIALYMLEVMEGHYLRFSSPPLVESEDFENLRLEVAANSAPAAEDRALNIIYQARRAAGLPPKVVPVAWVAPRGHLESDENYLDEAEELVKEERYGLAIVAAEIHLEAQVKAIIERAVRRVAPTLEEVLLQHRNNLSLRHAAGRKMIERFLGFNVTHLPEWQGYQGHLGRRNEVAHAGKSFDEEEAEDSIAIVRKMWLRLADASRATEETSHEGELLPHA